MRRIENPISMEQKKHTVQLLGTEPYSLGLMVFHSAGFKIIESYVIKLPA